MHRIGGLGYLFDNGGNGYSIGRDAIRAALCAEDGSGEQTLLHKLVTETLGNTSAIASLGELYALGKRGVASYAPLVFRAADEGDGVARNILRRNMKEIAALLDDYIPGVEELMTKLKKTSKAAKEMRREITDLKKEVNSSKASALRQLELEKKMQELDDLQHMVEALQQTMDAIPAEILAMYKEPQITEKGEINRE